MAMKSDAAPRLRLTIDIPGFYVDENDTAEDIEAAMQLRTEQVAVVFSHTEGDSPETFVKPMEGYIVKYEVHHRG